MTFTISASGSKDEVLEQLDKQRDPDHPHAGLKNGIIDHLEGHVDELDDTVTNVSVSVSGQVIVEALQASPAPAPDATDDIPY